MGEFTGKVALVTGAAGGLGSAIVRLLVERGARVAFTDIDEMKGAELAKAYGSQAMFLPHDVSSAQMWQDVVSQTENRFGPISVLVNNAAIAPQTRRLDDYSEAEYRRVFEVNQLSVFLGMKAVAASMRRAGSGSIVNVSSVAGLTGAKHAVAYTATKFAITGMSKVAALDFAEDKIRVNSVHPGAIDTAMIQMPGTTPDNNPVLDFLKTLPIPRPGSPEEIANVVVFLASDAASFCTGSAYSVDGGFTA